MKRWDELTPEQRLHIRQFLNYLFDDSGTGFNADWEQFVIDQFIASDGDINRTLQGMDKEDHAEARAIIHLWKSKNEEP